MTPPAASPNDRTTVDTFDAAGRLRHSIDAAGYVTTRTFNALDQLIEVRLHNQPVTQLGANIGLKAVEARIAASATLDQSTTYTYDTAGKLKSTRDANGYTESQTYDGTGARITRTDQRGFVWNYSYDAAGNLLEQLDPAVDLTAISTDANGNLAQGATSSVRISTRFTYDGAGQVVGKTEAFGRTEQRTTTFQYDGEGRLTLTTFPNVNTYDKAALASLAGSTLARTETNAPITTQTIYNAFGQAVTQVDVNGNKSHTVYDALGQALYEIDALNFFTQRQFNRFGEVTQFTRFAKPLNASQPVVPQLSSMNSAATSLQSTADRKIVTKQAEVQVRRMLVALNRHEAKLPAIAG